MSQIPLTHKKIARILGVSETTIKSYRRKFPNCIPVASKGKPIRFSEEALEVCRTIRDLFSSGLSVQETHIRLSEIYQFIAPPVIDEPEQEAEQVEVILPDDYKQAMSSLATSMVNLSMKQDQVLKRMKSIDARLNQLGLSDVNLPEDTSSDAILTEIRELATRTEALFSQLSANLPSADSLITSSSDEKGTSDSAHKATIHRMVPLREAISHDPPRRILTLPLMIQESEGKYTSLQGRGNSRFSLNDLRASLMTHFTGNECYALNWSENTSGWQLDLTQHQATSPHNICLTMALTSTLKGSVMLIKDMTTNGHQITPEALQDFISDVYNR